jgi:hypothetical protein
VLFSLGCGSGNSRVTGTVTFDGKPVSEGVILLNDIKGRLGPDSGSIEGGRFDFEAKPGRKRVEIRASREVPQKRTEMGAYFEDYIPRRYNSQSILIVEVTPGGKNRWDFQLERDRK